MVDIGYHYPFFSAFSLAVSPDPLVAGQPATFTITDGAPFAKTWLVYSLNGLGSTYVSMLDVTLGLNMPKNGAGPDWTDGNGYLDMIRPIPAAAVGMNIWFQACQNRNASNVVATTIE